MSTNPPVAVSHDRDSGSIPGARPLRVLMVEDDEDDALLLQRHLRRAGFVTEVCRVETAEGMLEALQQPWDCILADYHLPLFSAPEALRLLKQTGNDIPFIMMSGAVSEDTAVAAMRAGAHDYVSKGNLARLGPAIDREVAEATSRRQTLVTERALRSSEERFHRLVEATPLALLICDMSGHISYSNRSAQKLLGFHHPAPDKAGFSLESLFHPEDFGTLPSCIEPARHVVAGLRREIINRGGETWEATCRRRDGTLLTVLIGAAVLNPEAPPEDLQLAVFFVDLTEQKRGEEVLRRTEKLAAAGRLAASIAHEINNPLEAITNCMYLLESGTLDPESRGYLEMAQRELDRVTQITTQTLRFYRQSTRPTSTDIGELLESVLALNERRIRDNGIEIVRDFDGAPAVTALDGEIRQVLANMIGNAIDALIGGPEPRTLLLRAHAGHAWHVDGPGLVLLIADSGSGISRDTLSRIFEPFFSTKGITGTGLGLWVSLEILQKHKGRVQVRSRQEHPSGTVFRIVLPLDSALSEQPYEAGIPILG